MLLGVSISSPITISYQKFDVAFVKNPVRSSMSIIIVIRPIFIPIEQSGGPNFMLEGVQNRNKALNGNIVVVKVLEKEKEVCVCVEYSLLYSMGYADYSMGEGVPH